VFKLAESPAQAKGVQLRDREDANTALGASRAAFEPVSRPPRRVGSRGIDDLHELVVACGEHVFSIV
jgi:hypothetical protein